MKLFNFILLIFLAVSNVAFAPEKSTRYPYGLLTSGYGIVTEDDLAYDAQNRASTPYDPTKDFNSLHWQCFPVSAIKQISRSWLGMDGAENSDNIYKMCAIEIEIQFNGERQFYVDRRGHRIAYCKEFSQSWNQLISGEDIVCLNGDGGEYQKDKDGSRYKLWTWEKVKTRKGCDSYFAGECKTEGCTNRNCSEY